MNEVSAVSTDRRRLWLWYTAGAAAFIPVFWLHYVGEEAIFPIASLEMWYRGEWARQILYGGNVQHNPLLNWLIIAISWLVGWEWMLQAARLVTVGATVSTGIVLAWLVRRVFDDRAFAAFAAVVYLMLADVALYRGWLAYVDPLFGFLVFTAVACLWVACRERRAALLALAVASLTLGFLAKALTAYVFYGVAFFVLFLERDHRRFLLSPASIALHAAAAGALALWLGIVHAEERQGLRMFMEIVDKLGFVGVSDYLRKLLAYPVETTLKLAPASLLAIYYAWRRKNDLQFASSPFRTAAAIAALSYLPYWLAPQSHTRYLLPIYPLAALVFAWALWNARPAARAITLRWFVGLLALKLAFLLVAFPYYQKTYRGENHARVARDILERAAGHPLYSADSSASGLSVTAHLDILRLPAAPLVLPPAQWDSGFVIAYTPDPKQGRVVEKYRLGGNELYLLCRGSACPVNSEQ